MIRDVSVHHRSINIIDQYQHTHTHTHTHSNLIRMTAWTVVGSVTLWRLRSLLFRFSTQGGRLTSVLILFFTIFHRNRRRKDRRKEHQRTSYSFGITILGAITVVLSHVLRKNRRKSWWIKQLQRVLLISETPRLLYSSFEENDSDTIGITALLLGT